MGTKPVIKAILKTKKMSSRFDQIAAQCLGQAEMKRGRGQKEEIVERLPLQSDDSCSSDFNPLMSPASKSGKFSHDFEEHLQNKGPGQNQNHYINSISSTPSMTTSVAAACPKLPQNGEEMEDTHAAKKDAQPNKKRQRKAYTKRNKKIDDNVYTSECKRANGVRFAEDGEALHGKANNMQGDVDFEAANESCWNVGVNINDSTETLDRSMDFARLTNKKKQYLQDAIVDKNGAYSFLEDPVEYKKARKRLQNRESAVRSRQRKKSYQETLEQQLGEQSQRLARVAKERDALKK